MTITETAQYISDGNTVILWLEGADSIVDLHAPTLQELEPAIDISMEVTSGGFNPNISEGTVEAGSIGTGNVAQSIGRTTVAPALTFWRRRPPGDKAWDMFRKGDVGYLIWRSGYLEGTPLADGQEIGIGLFEVGSPQPEFPGGETNTTFVLNFALVRGDLFDLHAVIAEVQS